MAMEATLKARWVKALRSGRYKQTKEVLEDENGANCCIGVLCRIKGYKKSKEDCGIMFELNGIREKAELNEEMLKKVGLTHVQQRKLIHMNDGLSKSFKEIADYIEKKIPVKKAA